MRRRRKGNGCTPCLVLAPNGVMFTAALPAYLYSATSTEREKASRIFGDGQARIEDAVSVRIRAYSQLWLDSAAGKEYGTRYIKAK